MKFTIMQPAYTYIESEIEEKAYAVCQWLKQVDESTDVLVLPEYCSVPGSESSGEMLHVFSEKLNKIVLEEIKKTAKRCHCLVFFNMLLENKNTTAAMDESGKILFKYEKIHVAPSEIREGVDDSYCKEFIPVPLFTYQGVTYTFMTCYDFYFYERFPLVAKSHADVIIGCSLQRTDTCEVTSFLSQFLCYNTNMFLVRSSMSLGKDAKSGGNAMVVSPKGEILLNAKNEVGLFSCEIDPKNKFYKAGGFGGGMMSHDDYRHQGYQPWQYPLT